MRNKGEGENEEEVSESNLSPPSAYRLEQRSSSFIPPRYSGEITANGILPLRLHVHGNPLHYRMLQPIFADCILCSRRKSTAKKSERETERKRKDTRDGR